MRTVSREQVLQDTSLARCNGLSKRKGKITMTNKQITAAIARITKAAAAEKRDACTKVYKLKNESYFVLDGYRALCLASVPEDIAAAAVPAEKEWPGLEKLVAGFIDQQAKSKPIAAPDRAIAAALLKESKKAACRLDADGAAAVAVKAQYIRDMCDALPGAYWSITSCVSPIFAVNGADFGIVLPMRVADINSLPCVNAPAAAQPEEIPAPVEEKPAETPAPVEELRKYDPEKAEKYARLIEKAAKSNAENSAETPAQDTAPAVEETAAPVAAPADPIAAALALPARRRRVDRLHAAEKAAPVEEKPALPVTPLDIKPGARNDSFEGTSITGNGYTITFDKQESRTLIKFDKKPAAAVLALLKEEGFFWSHTRAAWVKGLNMKAYRAALRVNAALAA